MAELDGSNQVVATFAYGTHVNVPEVIQKVGASYPIVHDHLGSPRLVVDQSTGSVVQRVDYDEWGIVTLDTNPGFQPFGFAGGIYDSQTRLIRFGARDYDAFIARWTTKDPIGFGSGVLNLMQYAANDPLGYHDPNGGCPWVVVAGGIALGIVLLDLAVEWWESYEGPPNALVPVPKPECAPCHTRAPAWTSPRDSSVPLIGPLHHPYWDPKYHQGAFVYPPDLALPLRDPRYHEPHGEFCLPEPQPQPLPRWAQPRK